MLKSGTRSFQRGFYIRLSPLLVVVIVGRLSLFLQINECTCDFLDGQRYRPFVAVPILQVCCPNWSEMFFIGPC